MAVFHQLGHDSFNLVKLKELNKYAGVILSPVNANEGKITSEIESLRTNRELEIIFDPQLYYPRTERQLLLDWSYFPAEVDTANVSEIQWWRGVSDEIIAVCKRIKCDSICTPVLAAGSYPNSYYNMMVDIGNYMKESLEGTEIEALQTVIINPAELEQANRSKEIASIITKSKLSRVYLIISGTIEPRRELSDSTQLKNIMVLINDLETAGLKVLVGFCSLDFVMWKYAGASSCATGKFFNLRRFTSSRFEEPAGGGGQLPYWAEENLLAYLREGDLIRVLNENLINKAALNNPFSLEIMKGLDETPEKSWLGLSWRQYLYTFADLEERINTGQVNVPELLINAESNWDSLNEKDVLMEESRNNGNWIRKWRIAISEFNKM